MNNREEAETYIESLEIEISELETEIDELERRHELAINRLMNLSANTSSGGEIDSDAIDEVVSFLQTGVWSR